METAELYSLLSQIEEAAHAMRAALELAVGSQQELREVANDEWDAAWQRLQDAYTGVERIEERRGRESGS